MQDPLIEQYEAWMYPKPIEDLTAYVAGGGHDLSDPARMRRKLWPRPIEPDTLDILVAGCGANQAAIIAHANPQHRVLGIDLSGKAIAHHAQLKQRHGLDNLELRQVAIEAVPHRLDRQFDYIVSTGVLHHLNDPAAGLACLRAVLAPHGVMSLMLYGQNRRAGLYLVQEALHALGAQRDAAGVALARDTMAQLPAWHSARSYLDTAPDLHYDAGLVDTLLNARDRAYTVPEILALVKDTGLRFQGWLDGLYYSPSAAFAGDAKIHDRVHDLPRELQWHVVDLLAQAAGAHRFLVCHTARTDADLEPDFSTDAWLDAVPVRHPDLVATAESGGALKREWHSAQLDGKAFAVFQRIDGYRTFRELLKGTAGDEREYIAAVMTQLLEWDHLFCRLP